MIALLSLLALGAPPDPDAALLVAVRNNNIPGIREALQAGADPNSASTITRARFLRRSTTSVIPAIEVSLGPALGGDLRALTLLLEAGADANTATRAGSPLLHHVVQEGQPRRIAAVVDTLLTHGAEPNGLWMGAPLTRRTPPRVLRAILPRLIEGGANPGAYLCGARDAEVREQLLALDPDPNAWCGSGRPLTVATHGRDLAWMTALLDAGADPDGVGLLDLRGISRPEPASALHIAANKRWTQGLELLLARGADPNVRAGRLGGTPLSVAEGEDAQEVLVRAGALRLDPDLPWSLWSLREPAPEEAGAYLAWWLEEEGRPLHPTWEPHFEPGSRSLPDATLAALPQTAAGLSPEALGSVLEGAFDHCDALYSIDPPRLRELKRDLGRPTTRERDGALQTYTWEAASGRPAQARRADGQIFEVTGACGAESEGLIGQPMQALRAILGPPRVSGLDWDRWFRLIAYYDEDGRVVRTGRVWVASDF